MIYSSADLSKNFAVHRHCLLDLIEEYLDFLPHVRRLSVVTDNCGKQYRNKNLYGFVSDFCREYSISHVREVSMAHCFLEKYHGKGTSDGICGLLKVLYREEANKKDSKLKRKKIIYSHVAIAEFGRKAFGRNEHTKKKQKARQISEFKFKVVNKGDVQHGNLPQYQPQKYLTDSSESLIWSDCSHDHGDLRSRAGICACDSCNNVDGTYYDCELPHETGAVLKWYMAPNNAEEYAAEEMNIDARKRAHADIQETFCMSLEKGQMVAYPIKEGSDAIENERPYYYHLAGTFFPSCTSGSLAFLHVHVHTYSTARTSSSSSSNHHQQQQQ